jgi:hypothetical protein
MRLTIFGGTDRIAAGTLAEVAAAMQAAVARGAAPVLAFDDATGSEIDFDLRGSPAEVAARHAPSPKRGRPRLGVVAREVTLLPRHWDWLGGQKGGASAALRRLVETAMRAAPEGRDPRRAQAAAYRAATALAGDRPGYEEAMRALFASDAAGLADRTAGWPADVRAYVLRLASGASE